MLMPSRIAEIHTKSKDYNKMKIICKKVFSLSALCEGVKFLIEAAFKQLTLYSFFHSFGPFFIICLNFNFSFFVNAAYH